MASINTINVGGIDRSIEDSTARASIVSEAARLEGSISNEASRLDRRIDEVISPSGGAPSAAEVTDIRVMANGDVYANAGGAVRKQITDLTNTMGAKTLGLDFTYSGFINENGVLTSNSAFMTSGYIGVSGSIYLKGKLTGLVSPYHYINCYNSSKGFIKGINGHANHTYNNDLIMLDSNVAYIRLTTVTNDVSSVSVTQPASKDEGIIYKMMYDNLNEDVFSTALSPLFPEYTTSMGYIREDGTLAPWDTDTFLTTSFIKASGIIFLTGKFQSLDSSHYYLNCYNQSGGFISGMIAGAASTIKTYSNEKITLPEGTRFIRITTSGQYLPQLKIIISMPNTDNLLAIASDAYPTYTSENGYIKTDGSFAPLSGFYTTDYIPGSYHVLLSGTFRSLDPGYHYVNCYDENKNFIEGLMTTNSGEVIEYDNHELSLPAGTRFIRVTVPSNRLDELKVLFKAVTENNIISYLNNEIENIDKYIDLLGFSAFDEFVTIGDSLTDGWYTPNGTPPSIYQDRPHSWPAYIEKATGSKAYWTGRYGETTKTWLETTSETWGVNYMKSLDAKPLYLYTMGANEYSIPTGDISDINSDSPTTLYGYVGKAIREIRSVSPDGIIICTGEIRAHSSKAVDNVYRNVCNKFSKCLFMDCYKELNSSIFAPYVDVYHYTPVGYSIMASLLNYKLKHLMINNKDVFLYAGKS